MLSFLYQYFFYPIDKEPIDTEPIDKEPIDTEPIDKEPIDKEPIDKFYYLSLFKQVDGTFSIHGLWPQTNESEYPSYCKKVIFSYTSLYKILNQLTKYWHSSLEKDELFWKHEWEKHGSCVWTKMDEVQYFTNVLSLYYEAKQKGLSDKYYDSKTKKCLIPVDKNLKFMDL